MLEGVVCAKSWLAWSTVSKRAERVSYVIMRMSPVDYGVGDEPGHHNHMGEQSYQCSR